MVVRCPLNALFGLHCPTCGLTRACLALMQGELTEALRLNPLVIPAMGAALLFPVILLIDLLTPHRLLARICLWRRKKRDTAGDEK